MAITYSYPLIDAIADDDLLIISDKSKNLATNTTTAGSIKSYVSSNVPTPTESTDSANKEYVDDGVVTSASFNTTNGTLELTRSSGNIPSVSASLDGRYALTTSLATVATSGSYNDLSNKPIIPTNNNQLINGANYTTNLGVVQSLTTTGTSGAATLTNGVLNVPQYSGGGVSGVTSIISGAGISVDQSTGDVTITATGGGTAGAYQKITRTFSGSELVNAFSGVAGEGISIVTIPDNNTMFRVIQVEAYINTSSGTTTYNSTRDLFIAPIGSVTPTNSVRISSSFVNSSEDQILIGSLDGVNTSHSSVFLVGGVNQQLGRDLALTSSQSFPAEITQGDRDITFTITYKSSTLT